MDELEISGKRYISTRRAAKEHKYHSDYIGQLIRAGKIDGQKVGRSWYVVAESLSAYLAKEPGAQQQAAGAQPVVQKTEIRKVVAIADPTPVEVEETEVIEVPIARMQEEPVREQYVPIQIRTRKIVEEVPEIVVTREVYPEPEVEAEEYHIPVKISPQRGLRYVPDNEPLFPAIKKSRETQFAHVQVMPTQVNVIQPQEERAVIRPISQMPKKKSHFFARVGTVVVIAALVLGASALISVHLISVTTIEQGQAANVGYSFQ